jgi:PEP-CTERM motif
MMGATMNQLTQTLYRACARVLFAASIALGSAAAGAVPYDATLLPVGGDAAGPAGTTIGWGYAVTNTDAALWLVFTGLGADTFDHGTPQALFDAPVVAPTSAVSNPYDGLNGLYALTWDGDAPEGFLNTGEFVLHAQWWDGDPLAGGRFVADADDVRLAYTALVMPPDPGTVPEPASALLVLLGGGVIAARRASARRQRSERGAGRRADVEHV